MRELVQLEWQCVSAAKGVQDLTGTEIAQEIIMNAMLASLSVGLLAAFFKTMRVSIPEYFAIGAFAGATVTGLAMYLDEYNGYVIFN